MTPGGVTPKQRKVSLESTRRYRASERWMVYRKNTIKIQLLGSGRACVCSALTHSLSWRASSFTERWLHPHCALEGRQERAALTAARGSGPHTPLVRLTSNSICKMAATLQGRGQSVKS